MKHGTIGRRLATAVVAAALISGLLGAAMSCRQAFSSYIEMRRENLLTTANAFSAAIAGPMAAKDNEQVFAALRAIGQVPRLLHARARDLEGRTVGELGYGARLDADPDLKPNTEVSWLALLKSRSIDITVPVVEAGQDVGSLELLSDAGDLLGKLLATLTANLAGAAVALVAGLVVAFRMQRSITRPLTALTTAMHHVQSQHDYSVTLPPVKADEVNVLIAGFNAMLSDIRTRDEQLIRHRDSLEQDVADRTRDLAHAKTVAEQANAAKSTFLATMSHEIRTPMTGLLVMAELLASGDLPQRARRYADVISRSGTALLAIINDVLDFSKIEAGKLEAESVPLDLAEIVGTVVNLFYARASEKGLDLAAILSADVPRTTNGDPVRLQQVIGNLVNNALKFTTAGHVLIEVTRRHDGQIAIAVEDTGIGIPADKIDAIFEAFTQADGSTTREFGGTGLGLSISSRLSEAMGGSLEVQSIVGTGSRFTLLLPSPNVSVPSPALANFAPTQMSILNVRGEATRRCLASLLSQAGFGVASALATDDRVPESRPSVLIADADVLARMNGRSHADVVVAITEPGDLEADKLGQKADIALQRPILAADFSAVLDRIANGKDPRVAASAQPHKNKLGYPSAKVLVVDDTAVNREIMIEALARFSIVPDLAADGEQALRLADVAGYDLIFMDGSMPVLDGFEATRQLRRAEREKGTPPTPVIALTAHVVGLAADAWQTAGMDGVLHKPFTMKALEDCLVTWLSRRAQEALAGEPRSTTTLEAQNGGDTPILDPAVLSEIGGVEGGGGFAERVFRLYLEHAPPVLDQISSALADRNDEALAEAAHALKSMSFNIGAKRVALGAAAIEKGARAHSVRLDEVAALRADATLTLDQLAGLLPKAQASQSASLSRQKSA